VFTGIIEEIGTITAINRGRNSAQLVVKAKTILQDVKLGDSIAVNGVCLTVVRFNQDAFWADIMAETLIRSSFSEVSVGTSVNLERALRLSDRLGGHIVSGHIDGVGRISIEEHRDFARILTISAPAAIIRYVVEKGSIAIDGASLTVVSVSDGAFQISLVPHTQSMTTLGAISVGDIVNLEVDIIGKYIEKLLQPTLFQSPNRKPSISLDLLKSNGFI